MSLDNLNKRLLDLIKLLDPFLAEQLESTMALLLEEERSPEEAIAEAYLAGVQAKANSTQLRWAKCDGKSCEREITYNILIDRIAESEHPDEWSYDPLKIEEQLDSVKLVSWLSAKSESQVAHDVAERRRLFVSEFLSKRDRPVRLANPESKT